MNETCCKSVYRNGSYRGHPCGKKAKVEREGKWFCGMHDPIARKEKADVRQAEWNRKHSEWWKTRRLELSAPLLVEALKHIAEDGMDAAMCRVTALAALAKAEGKQS